MRTGIGWVIGFGFSVVAACGKGGAPAPDAAPATTAASADAVTGQGADAATPADAASEAAPELAADAGADAAADSAKARLEALSLLEIPGLTRVRAQLQGDLVTLQFDSAPNAKGNIGSVELTVSLCRDCAAPVLKDVEARQDQLKAQLGELHAKNPGLVLEIKELELMPQRVGVQVYSRSYVDDGTTRASVHMSEVTFADNGFAFRFQAYPRNGFPGSADELATAFTRAELDALVRTVFKAASDVLWPPTPKPE